MRWFIISSLVLGVTCTLVMAQDGGRPERVDQALKERYGGDATAEIVGTPTDVNGVKVFQVQIRDRRGESTAMVTEHGDFLLSGLPSRFEGLPERVRQTQTLFEAEPRDAQQYIADGYYIDVEQDRNQIYRVRYDAVGRLREIANPNEVERYETTGFKTADENIAGKIQELAERHIPEGSQIKDVYVDPRYQGFYVAKYVAPRENREILVILDEQGNIYQTRTEIGRDDLPQQVRESFSRMFDEDRIRFVYRTQYQFYQFDQEAPGGERVTFKVRPNGSIMDVQSEQAQQEEQAVQARFREGAAGPRQNITPERGRDRERRRDR